jgi:cytochrome b561
MTSIAHPVPQRYSRTLLALHWTMALVILAVALLMELREMFPKGSDPREAMKTLHFMLGLSVLAFVAIRLVVRFGQTTPPILPPPAAWQAG